MIASELSPAGFLRLLWPDDPAGYVPLWTKAGDKKLTYWLEGIEAIGAKASALHESADAYVHVAAHDLERARQSWLAQPKNNGKTLPGDDHLRGCNASAVALPGFPADIDAAGGAHAKDPPLSIEEIIARLKALRFPPTIIIVSGGGVYAWWLFREPWTFDSPDERESAARGLRNFLEAVGIPGTDPAAMDLARVLRPPGTLNHKYDPPRLVHVVQAQPDRRYNPSELLEWAEMVRPAPAKSLPTPVPSTGSARVATEDLPDAQQIASACAWVRHCRDDAATLSEPEWYALLSIVGRCKDGEAVAHEWSKPYAKYSQEETSAKLLQALEASGPRTCDNIRNSLGGEPLCAACPHWAKITSPIELGRPDPIEDAAKVIAVVLGTADAADQKAALLSDKALQAAKFLQSRAPARYAEFEGDLKKAAKKHGIQVRTLGAAIDAAQIPLPVVESTAPALQLYRETKSGGIERHVVTTDTDCWELLTNFTAKIGRELIVDDGETANRTFEIVAVVRGQTSTVQVLAAEFEGASWIPESLGAGAIVYATRNEKQHVRTAIQVLSGEVPRAKVYGHTGWRKIGDQFVFLHAGGGLSSGGPVPGIEVQLPVQLSRYRLPAPAEGERLRESIRLSLGFLVLAPIGVTGPLYCAVWRSVLGPSDLSIHLAGETNACKTSIACLAVQHVGSEIDADHVPASWGSTGNALEEIAFIGKNLPLLVDDLVPGTTRHEQEQARQKSERLFRGQGNQTGRSRLNRRAQLQSQRPPRGLVISTGEDLPWGHSLMTRVVPIWVRRGDIDLTRLTPAQAAAREGRYAETAAAYLAYLSPRIGDIHQRRHAEVEALLPAVRTDGMLPRTAMNLAELLWGLRTFLDFAVSVEAITRPEADALEDRCIDGLKETAREQKVYRDVADDVVRFLETLASVLLSGRAHVATPTGAPPANPAAWGWARPLQAMAVPGGYVDPDNRWEARGPCIGWISGENIYLEWEAAVTAAKKAAAENGEGIQARPLTLLRRLGERGVIASHDEGRLTARMEILGSRRRVVHLHAHHVVGQGSGLSGSVGENEVVHEKRSQPQGRQEPGSDGSHGSVDKSLSRIGGYYERREY